MDVPVLTPGQRLAHDINNVLFVLYGRCESMRDLLPSDHPVHADIDAITMAAERLESLLEDVKALDPRLHGQNCTDSSASAS